MVGASDDVSCLPHTPIFALPIPSRATIPATPARIMLCAARELLGADMELRNRWLHPECFIRYGTEAKARDYFALATSCFERLESASDPTARSDLKQMAHRSLEEAIKLLTSGAAGTGSGRITMR
jgi:hypothetical protein